MHEIFLCHPSFKPIHSSRDLLMYHTPSWAPAVLRSLLRCVNQGIIGGDHLNAVQGPPHPTRTRGICLSHPCQTPWKGGHLVEIKAFFPLLYHFRSPSPLLGCELSLFFSHWPWFSARKLNKWKFISLVQQSLNPWLGQVPLEGTKDNTSVFLQSSNPHRRSFKITLVPKYNLTYVTP